MDAPDDADDDRCRGFGRRWMCGPGTSNRPFDRENLRLRLPIIAATSRALGGADEADDDDRDVGTVSDDEVDVLEMVGIRAGAGCLCMRKGY
jgi:hypothetical protein